MTSAIVLGLGIARERLVRRRAALTVVLGAALIVVAAWIERRVGSLGASDRTLLAAFRVVIPLVALSLSAEASARDNLRGSVYCLARFGVTRRSAALGVVIAAIASSAVISFAFAVLAVLASGGGGALPVGVDALTSGWIGGLTGAAYASYCSLGASFGRRGSFRWAPVVVDWIAGGGTGLFAALFPRAHAESLLGGVASMGLSQSGSAIVLVIMTVIAGAIAALRAGS